MSSAGREDFIKQMLVSGRAIAVAAADAEGASPATTCDFMPAKYAVLAATAVDWTALHAVLRFAPAVHRGQLEALDAAVRARQAEAAAGAAAPSPSGDDSTTTDAATFVTSVEVVEPWELLPLDAEAAKLCRVRNPDPAASGAAVLQFKRGPPGQRSISEAAARTLADAAARLRRAEVACYPLAGSVVIISGSFDAALHSTAAVFQALRKAGLGCAAAASCFTPRALVFDVLPALPWSTLDLSSLGEHTAAFVAFAYAVALHDAHYYGGVRYGGVRRAGVVVADCTVEQFVNFCGEAGFISLEDPDAVKGLVEEIEEAERMQAAGPPSSRIFSVLEARLFALRAGFQLDAS